MNGRVTHSFINDSRTQAHEQFLCISRIFTQVTCETVCWCGLPTNNTLTQSKRSVSSSAAAALLYAQKSIHNIRRLMLIITFETAHLDGSFRSFPQSVFCSVFPPNYSQSGKLCKEVNFCNNPSAQKEQYNFIASDFEIPRII